MAYFSPYFPTVTSTPMTLAVFLSITSFLVTSVSWGFQAMDLMVIISEPQMTLLDYFLISVVIEELWDFWDYLRDA